MRIRRNVENGQIRSSETSKIRQRRGSKGVKHVMMPRSEHLCAANRHYLSCFNNDQCQDDYVAHVTFSLLS